MVFIGWLVRRSTILAFTLADRETKKQPSVAQPDDAAHPLTLLPTECRYALGPCCKR
jgi:hypothetical protein